MTDVNKKHLNMMLKQIEIYQMNELNLHSLLEKLWALYELIDDIEKTEELKNGFHKYWDFLEEIRAVNKINEYRNKIDSAIIPQFKNFLQSYLNNA